MIRTGYSVDVSEKDLGNEDFFGDVFGAGATSSNAGATANTGSKRKLADAQTTAIMKLESLDLDSEDEDVLILDTEGDPLLALDGIDLIEPEVEQRKPKDVLVTRTLGRVVVNTRNNVPLSTSANNEGSKDKNKWLRSVVDNNGQLRCTVSNSVDNVSNSGDTESLMADTIKGLVNTYLTKRSLVVDEAGLVSTPLHVVKKLASEHGEQIHCEGTAFSNGYHRMELFSGNLRGIGEGMTMKIARQMAAIDLLEQAQLSGPGARVPPMALLPGWLTNPAVFRDLFTLCKKKDLPRIKIESKLNYDETSGVQPTLSKWRAVCTVGDLEAVGESEEDIFARREAAKEMYQKITNVEYKDQPIAIGRSCLRLGELGGTGFQPIMSNQKKVWLLKNRVVNNKLVVREDEDDLAVYDIDELNKDLSEADLLAWQPGIGKKLKVTVRNDDDDQLSVASSSISRCVSIDGMSNAGTDWF
ncbi:hypothetical protein Ocin01_03650 [Orchesella cincta]|uniref:Uncharacterized protein n=1 Tax=Orchesella cincta TaxID=48709 RepID=A0A1D2ND72_ORCCI|nr:hypothetical protein Ocin01_03650 [Orchesella cincta]